MQFGPRFLAESVQRINGVVFHELKKIRKRCVKYLSMSKRSTASAFSTTAEPNPRHIRLISA
jgi:hypothetical protein